MENVDYDARLHAVYAAGRQMSPDALRTWMEVFARHLPETRPLVRTFCRLRTEDLR